MSRRGNSGLTLVEVLVGAFVVTMACMSAASIYMLTARKMQQSMSEAEAATLAEAVRAYAEGSVNQGQTLLSHNAVLTNAPTLLSGLVWKLVVDGTVVAGTSDIYKTTLWVARDDDGDGEYDAADWTNAGVTTFVFYIKD